MIMKLKPKDHIVTFMEKSPKVIEMLKDGGAQIIMKMTNCDYIFLVDSIENADLTEVIDGVKIRMSIFPSECVEFKKVKYEEGMDITMFKEAILYESDYSNALLV